MFLLAYIVDRYQRIRPPCIEGGWYYGSHLVGSWLVEKVQHDKDVVSVLARQKWENLLAWFDWFQALSWWWMVWAYVNCNRKSEIMILINQTTIKVIIWLKNVTPRRGLRGNLKFVVLFCFFLWESKVLFTYLTDIENWSQWRSNLPKMAVC